MTIPEWSGFLDEIADEVGLSSPPRDTFIVKFSNKKQPLSHARVSSDLNISEQTVRKHLEQAYDRFEEFCPVLQSKDTAGKAKILHEWLVQKYRLLYTERVPIRSSDTSFDTWEQVCQQMLERQRGLTTNVLMSSDNLRFAVGQGPELDLDLVKHKQRSVSPEQVQAEGVRENSADSESEVSPKKQKEKEKYSYEQFFHEVLLNRQSKTLGGRIAILGEPGAGKTTLLQRIAYRLLNEGLGLPIWITLGDLEVDEGRLQDIQEYLRTTWLSKASLSIAPDIEADFQAQFRDGKVWLLLDGVDEISLPPATALGEIRRQIVGWVTQARVVITCRSNVWDVCNNSLADFDAFAIKDFNYPDQVKDFIHRCFAGDEIIESKGKRLWAELDRADRSRIQGLVKNPLRLMMLCKIWWEEEGLPENRAGLYDRYVQLFYHWKYSIFAREEWYRTYLNTESKNNLHKALGELAKRAIDTEQSRFRLTYSLVREVLGDPEEEGSNFWLALKLHWLKDIGVAIENKSERVYIFFHPSFQEYFASLAIDDWHFFWNHSNGQPVLPNVYTQNQLEQIEKNYRVLAPEWNEVLLHWSGREDIDRSAKNEFVESLYNFDSDLHHYHLDHHFLYEQDLVLIILLIVSEYPNIHRIGLIQESFYQYILLDVCQLSFGYLDTSLNEWFMEPAWNRLRFRNTITNRSVPYAIDFIEVHFRLHWQHREQIIAFSPEGTFETAYYDMLFALNEIDPENYYFNTIMDISIREGVYWDEPIDENTSEALPYDRIRSSNITIIKSLISLLNESYEAFFLIRIRNRRLAAIEQNNVRQSNNRKKDMNEILKEVFRAGELEEKINKEMGLNQEILKKGQLFNLVIRTLQRLAHNNIEVGNALFLILHREWMEREFSEFNYLVKSIAEIYPNHDGTRQLFIESLLHDDFELKIKSVMGLLMLGYDEPAWSFLNKNFLRISNKSVLLELYSVLINTNCDISKYDQSMINLLEEYENISTFFIIQTKKEPEKRTHLNKNLDLIFKIIDYLSKISLEKNDVYKKLIDILRVSQNREIREKICKKLLDFHGNKQELINIVSTLLNSDLSIYTKCIIALKLFHNEPMVNYEYLIIILDIYMGIAKTADFEYDTWFEAVESELSQKPSSQIIHNIATYVDTDTFKEHIETDSFAILSLIGNVAKESYNRDLQASLNRYLSTTEEISTKIELLSCLIKINPNHNQAVSKLCEIFKNNLSYRSQILLRIEYRLLKNLRLINYLIDLLDLEEYFQYQRSIVSALSEIAYGNERALVTLVDLLCSGSHNNFIYISDALIKIATPQQCSIILNNLSTRFIPPDSFSTYFVNELSLNELLKYCSDNLSYPKFYQSWNNLSPIFPIADNHLVSNIIELENQFIPTLIQQVKLKYTSLIPINLCTLEATSEANEIIQELCTQLYINAFPQTEIPSVTSLSQLRRELANCKIRMNVDALFLLIYDCVPFENLINILKNISHITYIAWITDERPPTPFQGFRSDFPDLASTIESWIERMS